MKLFSSFLRFCVVLLTCTGAACAMEASPAWTGGIVTAIKTIISPDGRFEASIRQLGHNVFVVVWDKEGPRICDLGWNGGIVEGYAVRFSPDSRLIAIASHETFVMGDLNGHVKLFSTKTGRCLLYAPGMLSDFSPDGQRLLVYLTAPNGSISVVLYPTEIREQIMS